MASRVLSALPLPRVKKNLVWKMWRSVDLFVCLSVLPSQRGSKRQIRPMSARSGNIEQKVSGWFPMPAKTHLAEPA